MRLRVAVLFVVASLCSANLSASALGLAEKTLRVGYATGFNHLDVIDPDGETKTSNSFQPNKVVITDWLPGGNRYWLILYQVSAVLDASENNIGQLVNQNGFSLQVQKYFGLSRLISPWLGMGVSGSIDRFTKRHTMDSEGFLQKRFDDRQQTSIGFVISAVQEWEVNRDWSVGLQAEHSFPLSNSVQSSAVTLLFLYNL